MHEHGDRLAQAQDTVPSVDTERLWALALRRLGGAGGSGLRPGTTACGRPLWGVGQLLLTAEGRADRRTKAAQS